MHVHSPHCNPHASTDLCACFRAAGLTHTRPLHSRRLANTLLVPNAERRERGSSYSTANRGGAAAPSRRSDVQQRQAPRRNERPQPPLTPRMAAVRQLIRIEVEGAFVGHPTSSRNLGGPSSSTWERAAQQAAAASNALNPRDQATMKNLVSGVTRMRRRLDYVLSKLTRRNMSTVDAGVRQVLRLALYELEYEGLASHALDEHVDLARGVAGSASFAPAFVNGVLREAGRRAETKTLPAPEDDMEDMSASTGLSERGLARNLSLQHSHPTWLASRWIKRFGREEAESLMQANNRPPVYTVRVNTLRGTTVPALLASLQAEGVEACASSLLPDDFIEIRSGLQTLLAKGFVSRGECLVQDVSAGLVVAAALDPQPGERVLDACAAPGGKTMFCASRMQGQGFLTALDTSAAKLQALGRQATVAGVPKDMLRMRAIDLREFAKEVGRSLGTESSTSVTSPSSSEASFPTDSTQDSSSNQDSTQHTQPDSTTQSPSTPTAHKAPHIHQPPSSQQTAISSSDAADTDQQQPPIASRPVLWDKVLLDAPCSGSGVLAKRADMRWRRTAQDVEEVLCVLQAELLDAACTLVRPGGVLVYSICSIEEDEGPLQVKAFLERHPNFTQEPIKDPRSGEGSTLQSVCRDGSIATFPHLHGVADGSFAARLRRQS